MSSTVLLWLARLGAVGLAGGLGYLLVRRKEPGPGRFLGWLLFTLPFGSGGYYTVFWALTGLAGLIFLGVWGRKHPLRLRLGLGSLGVLAAVALYCLSTIWAADRGSAAFAIARAPALGILALVLMQMDGETQRSSLSLIPFSGAVMTLAAIPLSFVPAVSRMVSWRGRLCGSFEYANSFALFLLLGIILSGTEEKRGKWRWGLDMILMLGILLSGSRTTFLLLGLCLICLCVSRRKPRFFLEMAGSLGAALLLSGLYNLGTEAASAAGRVLSTSTGDSSFLTRLLYWKDAVPVVLRHPFGLGYQGYRAVQGSIQHGVYHVSYVHNEVLQLALDIGWIPVILLIAALARGFFRRGAGLWKRLMIPVFAVHCMMDFDLQFLSLWLVLLCLMEVDRGREAELPRLPVSVVCGLFVIAGLYLGAGDTLYYLGYPESALILTPFHTQALTAMLAQQDEAEPMEDYADRILRLDPYSDLAYTAKANVAQARGDIAAMMGYSRRALDNAPYDLTGYQEYFDRLWDAYTEYGRMGDRNSAEICRQELLGIPERLTEVKRRSDPLAFRIQHRPELELGEAYRGRLRRLE